MSLNSETRLESWRRYGKKRRSDPNYRARQKEINKSWREKHAHDPDVLKRKAEQMRSYTKDPALRVRHKARWLVSRAIAAGKLTRSPCKCGALKVESHHEDYSKPLEVVWMCRRCHMAHHAKATGTAGERP